MTTIENKPLRYDDPRAIKIYASGSRLATRIGPARYTKLLAHASWLMRSMSIEQLREVALDGSILAELVAVADDYQRRQQVRAVPARSR